MSRIARCALTSAPCSKSVVVAPFDTRAHLLTHTPPFAVCSTLIYATITSPNPYGVHASVWRSHVCVQGDDFRTSYTGSSDFENNTADECEAFPYGLCLFRCDTHCPGNNTRVHVLWTGPDAGKRKLDRGGHYSLLCSRLPLFVTDPQPSANRAPRPSHPAWSAKHRHLMKGSGVYRSAVAALPRAMTPTSFLSPDQLVHCFRRLVIAASVLHASDRPSLASGG
jgi:hypothetical protein